MRRSDSVPAGQARPACCGLLRHGRDLFTVLAAVLWLASLTVKPALAQGAGNTDRLQALEQRLQQALGMIGRLSEELARLKAQQAAAQPAAQATSTAPASDEIRKVSGDERLQSIEKKVRQANARLDDVEDVVLDLEEKTGSRALVHAFDAVSLDLGGFLHAVGTHVNGEQGSATSFNRLTFELLAKAQLWKNWSAFVAQAFIRESSPIFTDPAKRLSPSFVIKGKSPTVIAWTNYHASDAFNIQVGRWITPHGIINIEHFPALLLDPEQPQFLRPFSGQTIFANFMTGVNVHGQAFAGFGGSGKVSYNFYVGNFVGNAEKVNYGGRLAYMFGNTGFTLGLNAGGGKRMPVPNSGYALFGADVRYDKGPILWKTEIFVTDEDMGGNRFAFYTQPALRFGKGWTAFYRYDFLDDGTGTGDKTEHAFGVTFKPNPNVHLRGIVTLKSFDSTPDGLPSADVQSYQLSATYSF